MKPSFFGSSESPLFGIYHPPKAQRARDIGVLICNPAPQEYMRTHWAFRRLAEMLAKAGFHVFRFDYFGTGDSAGASDEVSVAKWRANVTTAARELRDIASTPKLAAVGFRLGAALVATAHETRFSDLVLWEPVVQGRVYLRELRTIAAQHRERDVNPRRVSRGQPPELLGFPMPSALEQELAAIDLLTAEPPNAARVAIMVSKEQQLARALQNKLARECEQVVLEDAPDETSGASRGELQAALLSSSMLNAIVSHLSS